MKWRQQMKDRNVEYPNRYRLVPVEGTTNIYDVIPTPGKVSEEGTFVGKALMDHVIAAYGTTAGTASAFTLAGDGGFVLSDGATIRARLHVDSGATPTINVNGTGAKKLMRSTTKPMRAGTKAGTWLTATYCKDYDFFMLMGSGRSEEKMRFGNDPGQISSIQWLVYGDGVGMPSISSPL
jgi:hypothetical protein